MQTNTAPPLEEALFQVAVTLSGLQRAAFLDRACAGKPVLRERLEELLAARQQPDAEVAMDPWLPPTVLGLAPSTVPGEHGVGQVIGPYRLLEKIGEGGCGVVYVAEQTRPVRRQVALKVIKPGMDTEQVVARFEAERQALAMMDHPNIARILDAGVVGVRPDESADDDPLAVAGVSRSDGWRLAAGAGRPYFVMELVRGVRITDYCDRHHLSTRERLDLFIQVCHAIQHAHQKGIIHRDIKPSNILVSLQDGVPVPKVIDFGIAKATEGRLTDQTVYTQAHQFLGTPAYMSPEQAELGGRDIDTRSDIYSLGVLLYELLTGRPPFDPHALMADGLDALRRRIREEEPARPSIRLAALDEEERTTTASRRSVEPSKLLHQLRGDLDWIVMKCLEKDRARRYETANGLAMDLTRQLRHEPVVARPPSPVYRLQKAWRRHKLLFAMGATVTAALVVGVVALAFALVQSQKNLEASRRLTEARQTAANEALRAESVATFVIGLLEQSVATMSRQGNTRGLRSLLEAADTLTADRLAHAPAAELQLRTTLWRFYARFLNEHGAAARQGDRIRVLLSGLATPVPQLSGLLPEGPPENSVPLADYLRLHTIASRLWAGDTEWARRELGSLRTEFLQRNPPATNSVALALSTEGFCLHSMDRDAEAEPLLQKAFELAPRLTGFFASDQPGLTYAYTLKTLGKHDAAQMAASESVRWASPAINPSALECYSLLVESLCRQHKFEAADAVVRELLQAERAPTGAPIDRLPLSLLSWSVRAHGGQWREAAPNFARQAAAEDTPPTTWRIGAAAALSIGDVATYRELRRRAWWRFGASAEAEAALGVALGLLLHPIDDPTGYAVHQLLSRLEVVQDHHWSGAFLPLLRAVLAYREGDPATALLYLEAWETLNDPLPVRAALLRDEKASPATPFWKALMCSALNRPGEAVTAFAEGERRLEQSPLPGWDLLHATANLYIAHALHAESREALASKGWFPH